MLQIGGSDQWGNIVCGIELARRTDNRSLYGLTTPLIATASGAKMGKTAQGAVWLTRDRLSPYEYWQFWRNTEDADVGRFLRLFTDLPLDEIVRLEALGGSEINEAKKVLATEATRLAHGDAAADEASRSAVVMFATAHLGAGATLSADAYVVPGVVVPRVELEVGIAAFRLFTMAGLATSNGEARRLIRGGGARINDVPVRDEGQTITVADLHDDAIKLSAGRKHHRLVRAA